jgi:hypothetical protein
VKQQTDRHITGRDRRYNGKRSACNTQIFRRTGILTTS